VCPEGGHHPTGLSGRPRGCCRGSVSCETPGVAQGTAFDAQSRGPGPLKRRLAGLSARGAGRWRISALLRILLRDFVWDNPAWVPGGPISALLRILLRLVNVFHQIGASRRRGSGMLRVRRVWGALCQSGATVVQKTSYRQSFCARSIGGPQAAIAVGSWLSAVDGGCTLVSVSG